MMRSRSLWKMLTLAFSFVLLFAFLMVWITVQQRIRIEFSHLVDRGDREFARSLAMALANRNRDELEFIPFSPDRHMHPMMGQGEMGDREPPMPPRQRIVIVDREGRIIFHTLPDITEDIREALRKREGVSILVGNDKIGEVFVGSMLGTQLLPYQKRFLGGVARALLLSALFSALVAIAAVIFITYRIIRPIGELQQAAQKIGEGDLSVRLPSSAGRAAEFDQLVVQFNQMAANLRRSEERQRQLIADVSHELRTPVALLKSRMEMVSDGVYQLDERQLDALLSDVDRLSSLIEELRAISSMERLFDRLTLEKRDPVALCLRAKERFQPAARERSVQIVFETSLREGTSIMIDAVKIDRALDNLISNALRFAPSDSTITMGLVKGEGGYEFSIRDEGPGIAEEERKRIFERFYRGTGSEENPEGRGLGLAIVKSAVELHGGRVGLYPSEVGAHFSFFLPV